MGILPPLQVIPPSLVRQHQIARDIWLPLFGYIATTAIRRGSEGSIATCGSNTPSPGSGDGRETTLLLTTPPIIRSRRRRARPWVSHTPPRGRGRRVHARASSDRRTRLRR